MLVLSRRQNEKVVLPGLGIIIEVVAIRPGVVRLGLSAPPAVAILREELVEGVPARRDEPADLRRERRGGP
jgi:two-component system, OmpR family, response regulator